MNNATSTIDHFVLSPDQVSRVNKYCIADVLIICLIIYLQARVQGGGPRGMAPPPRNGKAKKKGHQSKFKLFHLYFATFLVDNITFSAIF